MKPIRLEVGDVVQVRPDYEKWGGFLVVVTEPKTFGCQGYLLSEREFEAVRFDGVAFVRMKYEDIEFVGKMHWIRDQDLEDQDSQL